MDKETLQTCPFCGCENFLIYWSQIDKRATPIVLKEKYTCSECGREFMQEWCGEGWKAGDRKGEGYINKCLECGCEDLEVQRSGYDSFSLERNTEQRRCDSCGVMYSQLWKANGWYEAKKQKEPGVNVIDHDRIILEEGDEDGST